MRVPLNIDLQQILLHLMNFVILFAILYFFLYGPVKKFMDNRREYYKQLDEEAKANFSNSEKVKKEYIEKMREVDVEIEQKKQRAHQFISEETAKSRVMAKQEAETILSDAYKIAESERNKILEKAQSEVADMIAAATEKLVLGSSTSESYDQFLTAVERGGENETGKQ